MDFGRDKNEEKEAGQDTGRKHGGQGKDRVDGIGLEGSRTGLLKGHGSNPHLFELLLQLQLQLQLHNCNCNCNCNTATAATATATLQQLLTANC